MYIVDFNIQSVVTGRYILQQSIGIDINSFEE